MKAIQRGALLVLLGLLALYGGDLLVARFHGNSGLGSVDVQIMWAIKQKDGRIDYELGDTETRPCVHSLFPHLGYTPCWYLTRHKSETITVGSIPGRFATEARLEDTRYRSVGRIQGHLTILLADDLPPACSKRR